MRNLLNEDILKQLYKKLFLLGIKYGPSLMAISCCLKIHLLAHSKTKDTYELLVNYINLILNIGVLFFLYCAGRYFNYCWKHRSLCRITLWGYIYYALFITLQVPHEVIHPLTIWYLIVVISATIYYKII